MRSRSSKTSLDRCNDDGKTNQRRREKRTNNNKQQQKTAEDRIGRIDRMKTLARQATVIEPSWPLLLVFNPANPVFGCFLLLLLLPSSCRRLGVSG